MKSLNSDVLLIVERDPREEEDAAVHEVQVVLVLPVPVERWY